MQSDHPVKKINNYTDYNDMHMHEQYPISIQIMFTGNLNLLCEIVHYIVN